MDSLSIEYLFERIYCFTLGECGPDVSTMSLEAWWDTYTTVATLVSLILATGVVYCIIRINQIMKLEREQLRAYAKSHGKNQGNIQSPVSSKWDDIEHLASSENPSDWRQAIMEADILLDALLTKAGFVGDTVGDKLKGLEKGEFAKLNEAWEAHKVRNSIAHKGSDYILTKRETRRVIELFRSVFNDFYDL
jgi:hypothetical protein